MKEKIEASLQSALGEAIVSVAEFNGQISVEVKRDRIVDVCKFLKEDLEFNYLSDLCGADMLDFSQEGSLWEKMLPRAKHILPLNMNIIRSLCQAKKDLS